VIAVDSRLVEVSSAIDVAGDVVMTVLSDVPGKRKVQVIRLPKSLRNSLDSGDLQRLCNACTPTTIIQKRCDQRFDVNITCFTLYL
jgi:hypothetical protein